MKALGKSITIAALLVGMIGCYAGTVETGLPPSNKVIKQAFATSWIFGLVPPPTVETAGQCPNGVARVETQLSFLNQLVGFLTFGIYTPMQIVVTCAAEGPSDSSQITYPREEIVVPAGAETEEIREAFTLAAERAVDSHGPVFVLLGQ